MNSVQWITTRRTMTIIARTENQLLTSKGEKKECEQVTCSMKDKVNEKPTKGATNESKTI